MKPSLGRLLWRGLRKKCPVCGGGNLYNGWLKMKERCPTCGYTFEREDGFFLGALVINVAVTEAAMLICIVLGVALTLPNPPILLFIVLGVVSTALVPIIGYPFSKTLWSAIDLAMHPLPEGDEHGAVGVRRVGGEGEHA